MFPFGADDSSSKKDDTKNTTKAAEDVTETNKEAGFRDLFYPKLMRFRTLNMFYQWMAVTLAYYGLTFSSTDLAGDPYANFCSGVAIEIPGTLKTKSHKCQYRR